MIVLVVLQEGSGYSPHVNSCWEGRGDRLLLWEPQAGQASAVLSGQARDIQPANRSLGGLCMHQSVDSEYSPLADRGNTGPSRRPPCPSGNWIGPSILHSRETLNAALTGTLCAWSIDASVLGACRLRLVQRVPSPQTPTSSWCRAGPCCCSR